MARPTKQNPEHGAARTRLLAAARQIVRTKGFAATSVDELCIEAGVSKGAFFHSFASKEALGIEAAWFWSETTSAFFANADHHRHADPLDRVLAYLDLRAGMISGGIADFTCLVGTMAQEAYATSPAIRDACWASIAGHAATLEADIAEAMRMHGIAGGWTARSLALHTQAVLQGAFVLAKASNDPGVAADSVRHLRRYFELLFQPHERRAT